MNKEIKTIYELDLHETLSITSNIGGKIEITRVTGGWVYAFDYPGFRQSPIVFVPFGNEFISIKKEKLTNPKKNGNKKEKNN